MRFLALACIAILVLGSVACTTTMHARVPRAWPEARACVQRCQARSYPSWQDRDAQIYECVKSCPGATEAHGDCPRRGDGHACVQNTSGNGGLVLLVTFGLLLTLVAVTLNDMDLCYSEGCGDR